MNRIGLEYNSMPDNAVHWSAEMVTELIKLWRESIEKKHIGGKTKRNSTAYEKIAKELVVRFDHLWEPEFPFKVVKAAVVNKLKVL